jgi:hypothetical protein
MQPRYPKETVTSLDWGYYGGSGKGRDLSKKKRKRGSDVCVSWMRMCWPSRPWITDANKANWYSDGENAARRKKSYSQDGKEDDSPIHEGRLGRRLAGVGHDICGHPVCVSWMRMCWPSRPWITDANKANWYSDGENAAQR